MLIGFFLLSFIHWEIIFLKVLHRNTKIAAGKTQILLLEARSSSPGRGENYLEGSKVNIVSNEKGRDGKGREDCQEQNCFYLCFWTICGNHFSPLSWQFEIFNTELFTSSWAARTHLSATIGPVSLYNVDASVSSLQVEAGFAFVITRSMESILSKSRSVIRSEWEEPSLTVAASRRTDAPFSSGENDGLISGAVVKGYSVNESRWVFL